MLQMIREMKCSLYQIVLPLVPRRAQRAKLSEDNVVGIPRENTVNLNDVNVHAKVYATDVNNCQRLCVKKGDGKTNKSNAIGVKKSAGNIGAMRRSQRKIKPRDILDL